MIIKYSSHKDIDLVIQILKTNIQNTDGTFTGVKIIAPINRVILDLEEIVKLDLMELTK